MTVLKTEAVGKYDIFSMKTTLGGIFMNIASQVRIVIDVIGMVAAVFALGSLAVAKITKQEKIYRVWEISRFVPMAVMGFNLFFR